METDQDLWLQVGAVAASIAAACILAVIVLAVREKRRTGCLPRELVGLRGGWGWFGWLSFMFLWSHWMVPGPMMLRLPLCILYPALDMALLIAFVALAARALSYAFSAEWHWRIGPWITAHLVWAGLFIWIVVSDVENLHYIAWAWVPAAIVAAFATPFFARLAYQEFVACGQAEPVDSPQPTVRDPRMPGRVIEKARQLYLRLSRGHPAFETLVRMRLRIRELATGPPLSA